MSRRAIGLAVAGVLALRLLAAGHLGLAADEAYYWTWSERLAWGYYDHPPAVAGVIAAGTALLGDTERGVRAAGLVLQAAAALALIPAGRDRSLLALLLLGSPLLFLGGMIASPDVPLLSAWGLALAAAYRRRPAAMGLAIGAALLSKLTAWILWPCIALAWPDKRDWRLYAAGALALAVAAPSLIWNARNDWIAYGFQLRHGLVAERELPGLGGLLEYLGAQAGLLNPLLLVAAIACWIRGPRDLWWWSSLLPFAAFGAASALGHSEPNWAAPAFLSVFVMLSRAGGWPRRLGWWGGWLGAGLSALVLAHGLHPLFAYERDPTQELHIGRSLGRAVAEQAAGLEGPVLTSRYQEAAWIQFYGGLESTTLPGVGREDQYDLWPRVLPERGLYVRRLRGAEHTDADGLYARVGEPVVAEARVGDRLAQRWQIYRVIRRGAP